MIRLFIFNKYIWVIDSLSNDPATKGFKIFPELSIAEVYLSLHQYNKARNIFLHHLEHERKGNYPYQVMQILLDLGKMNYDKRIYKQAILYGKEVLQIAQKTGIRQFIRDGNQLMFQVYDQLKKADSAYYFYRRYTDMKDAMSIEQFGKRIALYNAVEEDGKKKTQILLLNNQNQINQQQIKIQQSALNRKSLLLYIFIAALFVMVILGILLERNIRLKTRKEQLQQLMEQVNVQQKLTMLQKEKTDLEMQALRAQMNPHFIFNCLSSINRFILINKTEEASDYLTKFSRLIRMALHNSEKSFITLENELEALRLYLDLERLRFKNAFNYSITLINTIDISAVFIPPMLMQPFAENAIWHGLMHKKGTGCLEIKLCAEDKILTCVIMDDGIGRNMSAAINSKLAEKNKSMGVQITIGRLALLNKSKNEQAIFNIEDLIDNQGNGCGTKVVLKIPVNYTS